ncbi:hypothetical protein BGZ63DRAFT_382049 [Mariannaea sp. PMI_226]|nr:hypothetical protein BGZ63DRAFT_382049 [Mariannaea sp. PMI_226]
MLINIILRLFSYLTWASLLGTSEARSPVARDSVRVGSEKRGVAGGRREVPALTTETLWASGTSFSTNRTKKKIPCLATTMTVRRTERVTEGATPGDEVQI